MRETTRGIPWRCPGISVILCDFHRCRKKRNLGHPWILKFVVVCCELSWKIFFFLGFNAGEMKFPDCWPPGKITLPTLWERPMPGAHSTWAWDTPDRSIKSEVACIAQCSRDIRCIIGTCWLLLQCFHILITHYHCMATQIWWLPNIQWNQCSMLKFMFYHINIMCLSAQSKSNDASAFQYNPSSFAFSDWTSGNVLSVPHFFVRCATCISKK